MSYQQIIEKHKVVINSKNFIKRISKKEQSEIQVPIDKDELKLIYKNEKEIVYCNTLDLNNLNICFETHKQIIKDGIKSIIIKSKQEDIKDYNKSYECGICLENIKFVNYKAKSAYNKIAEKRNSKICNPLIKKTKSKYSNPLKLFRCSVDDGFTTQCGHKFHKKCILKSLMINNTDCPICRYNLIYKT